MNSRKKIETVIAEEGKFVSTTSGVSMKPLFADRRDTIIVLPPCGRLKKYDVPLYRRGEEYVLHRIVKVLPDSYVICGDNCENLEYGITDSDIIGVLSAFYRKDKYYTVKHPLYRLYSVLIVKTFRVRMLYRSCRRKLAKTVRKFIKKKKAR
ncbi:MAG: hypothetical protein IKU65_05510 [Oscillospiraceae bacterium]|nr:hypothetical protein [Oscillospiraceae bacterium]